MRKFKLHPKVACVNTIHGLCEDHNKELKESDFPKGNADKFVKLGFLIEIDKPKPKKVEKVEKK